MRKFVWTMILFTALPVYGQQNYASISFGVSKPLGDYGLTGDLASNGYARTGGAIKFDAAYFPGSYLGIGGSFSFGSNYAIRDSLLQDMFAYVLENASSIDIPPDANITYGTGFWNYINLFIGPHYTVRASQRLYFDIRILAGISVLRPPDRELLVTFDGTEIHSAASHNKLTFGFTAGGGLRYKLNEGLALKLGIDMVQAPSRFEYNFDLFDQVAGDIPAISSDFWLTALEISVGMAYAF
ncbi:MAG: outer membrane beta-barrel protein [Bacteroidota bacterium]